jgi:hypothetical protein
MHWRVWDLLPKPLMRSSLSKVQDRSIEKPVQLPLLEDQEMIQAFSPHASQKTFTDRIRSRCSLRRTKLFDATCRCHLCEIRTKFLVIIPDEVFRCLSISSCLSQVLGNPKIRRRSRHIHMQDLSRLQFDHEEGEKWTKKEIGHLQEIASPYLCRMIVQKGFPRLSTCSCWTGLLHILLDRSLTHANIQLEEFSTDTLRSPKPIRRCHLLDQADRLERELRLSRMHF